MPKYKNGKVVISYDLIRRKGRDLIRSHKKERSS
jgi:hypothetical protein